MYGLASDLRLALRSLRRRPGFSFAVVAVLALGLGAATAIFSLVYEVLLRPLPYPRPDELVEVRWAGPEDAGSGGRVSAADAADLRRESRSLAGLALVSEETFALGGGDRPERVAGARVDDELFAVLALPPAVGRLPRGTGERGAAVSASLAARRYGGPLAALGRELRVDDERWRIAAVVPDTLDLPRGAEVWLPMAAPDEEVGRGARYLLAFARLAPGVGLARAEQEVEAISRRLAERHPATNAGTGARLVPLARAMTAPVRPALLVLWSAVAFLLLVVGANAAAMLLARIAARGPELGLRVALGGGRGRLLRAVAVESVLLALVGALAGLGIAAWSGRAMVSLFPLDLPRIHGFHLGAVPVAVHFAVALAGGLLIGLVPGLRAGSRALAHVHTGGGRWAGERRTGRLLGWILVPQVAVTLVLLVAAGLLVGSLASLLAVDPGFRTAGRLSVRVVLPAYDYPDEARRAAFFRELMERLRAAPEVAAAGGVTNLPLSGSNMLFPVRRTAGTAAEAPQMANYRAATPGYFAALGIPVRGRGFTAADRRGSTPVALVNEALARQLYRGDALGRTVVLAFGEPVERRIVGVVADVHHFGLAEPPRPEVYLPHAQAPWPFLTVVVAAREGDPRRLVPRVRSTVAALDPSLPLDRVATLHDVVAGTTARPRFYGSVTAAFGLVGLLVAAMGIYGVTAYAVRLRGREIGVRIALGSTRGEVLRLLLRRPLALVLAGVVAGSAAAALFARALGGLLFHLSPADPRAYAAAALVLVATAALAGGVPARRASRRDVVEVLARE